MCVRVCLWVLKKDNLYNTIFTYTHALSTPPPKNKIGAGGGAAMMAVDADNDNDNVGEGEREGKAAKEKKERESKLFLLPASLVRFVEAAPEEDGAEEGEVSDELLSCEMGVSIDR